MKLSIFVLKHSYMTNSMPPSVVHICFRNINFRSCHAIDCEIIFYVEISRLKKFVVYILVSVPCIVVMAGAN